MRLGASPGKGCYSKWGEAEAKEPRKLGQRRLRSINGGSKSRSFTGLTTPHCKIAAFDARVFGAI